MIITRMETATVIEIQQHLPILLADTVFLHRIRCRILFCRTFFVIFQIKIGIFPVLESDCCRILRLLHPAFNLEGINPALDHLRDQFQCTDILKTQQILWSLCFRCPVKQSARLCALSTVATSAADKTAEQALTGIAIAECTMYKAFNLKLCLIGNLLHLCHTQFSGCNNPLCTFLFQKLRPIHSRKRHLGTCVDRKIWEMLPDKTEQSDILHDHRIQPLPVIREQIIIHLFFHLTVFDQCIHGQIQSSSMQMHIINCL